MIAKALGKFSILGAPELKGLLHRSIICQMGIKRPYHAGSATEPSAILRIAPGSVSGGCQAGNYRIRVAAGRRRRTAHALQKQIQRATHRADIAEVLRNTLTPP